MKYFKPFAFVLLGVAISCSNEEQNDLYNNSKDDDTIQLKLIVDKDPLAATRTASGLFNNYETSVQNNGWQWRPFRYDLTNPNRNEYLCQSSVRGVYYNTADNQAFTVSPVAPQYTKFNNFFIEAYSDYLTYNIALPKNIIKSNWKVDFAVTNTGTDTSLSSTLENFKDMTLLPVDKFQTAMSSNLGHDGKFSFNNTNKTFDGTSKLSKYDNTLYISGSNTCYFASENLFNGDNTNNTIHLKNMSAGILIMTDEFNQYQDMYLEFATGTDGVPEHGAIFESTTFTVFDWKTNRRISEYMPTFNFNYTAGHLDRLVPIINSYEVSMINPRSRKQYNILDKKSYTAIPDQSTIFGFPLIANGGSNTIFNMDEPIDYYTHRRIRYVPEDRYLQPVCSRRVVMPYGRPYTLDESINGVNTHFDGTGEQGKEIKYLIVNLFLGADPLDVQRRPDVANKWFRCAYEIPAEGFTPNTIYIIRNRPGTKLFKEWDETNATTRGGNDDSELYVIDKSCYEIEEISVM